MGTPGDFSASQLPDVVVKQSEIWADPVQRRIYDQPVNSAKAVMENQNVRFEPLVSKDTNNCIGVKVVWLNVCDGEVIDMSDENNHLENCNVTGEETFSESLVTEPNVFLKRTFFVSDARCKDAFAAQQIIAELMLRNKQMLEVEFNKKVIATLAANAMANADIDSTGMINGTVTEYPAEKFQTPELMAEFALAAERNKIKNPIALSGSNFYHAVFNSQYNRLDDDKRNEAAKFGTLNWYWDTLHLDQLLNPARSTFVFDSGGIAVYGLNNYQSLNPTDIKADLWGWKEPTNNLRYRDGGREVPLYVDVTMQRSCDVRNGRDRVNGWAFELQLRAAIALGPEGCDGETGILQFNRINGGGESSPA